MISLDCLRLVTGFLDPELLVFLRRAWRPARQPLEEYLWTVRREASDVAMGIPFHERELRAHYEARAEKAGGGLFFLRFT